MSETKNPINIESTPIPMHMAKDDHPPVNISEPEPIDIDTKTKDTPHQAVTALEQEDSESQGQNHRQEQGQGQGQGHDDEEVIDEENGKRLRKKFLSVFSYFKTKEFYMVLVLG